MLETDPILATWPTSFDECIARAVHMETLALAQQRDGNDFIAMQLNSRATYWRQQAARYL